MIDKKVKKKNNFFWIYAVILAILLIIFFFKSSFSNPRKIDQDTFFEILMKGEVQKIIVKHREIVHVYLKKEFFSNHENPNSINPHDIIKNENHNRFITFPLQYEFEIGDLQFFQRKFEEYKKKYNLDTIIDFKNQQEYTITKFFFDYGVFLILLIIFWIFVFRRIGSTGGGPGGQIFNIGKSRAKLFDENDNVKITFKDVAGLEGAKEEVQEIVEFLKSPQKYTKLGGKIPKGALLIGPPGTGKTLLAKAVAGEAQVPFFSLSGSDFVEMFVGVGASRVRDLFEKAKEKSPCIIFIDEIDAIGRARGKSSIAGSNDERENTLNQLLTEMDGFGTHTNVIVLSATNRSDILDKALLRPGRFDRTILVDPPELNERKEIFRVHLQKLVLSKKVDIDFLARQTPGFSGADIANICNESALIAARRNRSKIENKDFLDAIDRIIGGLEKKNKIIKPNEKKRIAYHEAGHATISWLLEHAAPLVKVTIVPRGKSLGSAWYLPEERQLTTPEQMKDEMCALLAGRSAEEIIFSSISTGALNDLERVTKQAQSMVAIFGLNDRIGNISYYDSTGQNEFSFSKPYSEKTAQIIDEEISKIITEQYQRAKKILKDNEKKLSILANELLEKEVIFREDLKKIFGDRPFSDDIGDMLTSVSHP
ncbi:MAG: ATP-dependent zinc metalloprotease FtsH [Flavobacteriales bacterium]|jgi:cell division protease FtsH|uniref:ATP-dependent zinc metalloprotease FtsH n=1 Tax=Blattabacterium sp. (Mastotermes darwiniensis) TaxID=39768 RepID=UPI000231DE81|nr:ATP-dependent zinc metalloprotease FtsH [Blattabacterium sp. (Mastotermes darwiniensis)]AER40693.1 AAA-metalloprotease FtsH [Blattabacterium sp. (Mastotermes darwiniensis) str. MADAR]MDR1804779.1 ATP-dependent zinc metalloprotease FtsH [Flavobacteriales bacterium]